MFRGHKQLLLASRTLLLVSVLVNFFLSELPWWVRKNIASLYIASQNRAYEAEQEKQEMYKTQILLYLQPDRETLHAPDAAASLLRYLVFMGMEEPARNLVLPASRSNSPNPLMWYNLAQLAEANQQWSIASLAWPKAGFLANVKMSLDNGQLLILDDFDDFSRWRLHPGDVSPSAQVQANGGEVSIRYQDQPSVREHISYYMSLHHFYYPAGAFITLEAWTGSSSYLTLDVVLDGKAERLIAYEPGKNQWKRYTYPLPGGYLDRVLIGLGEPDGMSGDGTERQLILRQLEISLPPSSLRSTP